MEDFELYEYGTEFYVRFLHARLITASNMLEVCAVAARLPHRRGRGYRKLMRELQPGLDLMEDTTTNEVEA